MTSCHLTPCFASLLVLGLFALGPLPGCAAPAPADGASQTADFSAGGDGRDPATAKGDRVAATALVFGRTIRLHLSDADDAGWASIDDGSAGDGAWLDRSFDGGLTWASDAKLGATSVPGGSRGWRTTMFNVDDAARRRVGALRACGKAGNRDDIACTPWFRTTAHGQTDLDAAATSLMAHYDASAGTWAGIGWWNSANALTAIVDYSQATNDTKWRYAIATTFNAKGGHDFTNDYMDDTAWWGLAWVRSYDLTGDARYLAMAKKDADYLWSYADATCGGGLWWSTGKKYKNAITNELFIKLAASIHNRTPGDARYADHASAVWSWFRSSGMINAEHLVNDGLDAQCQNNNGTTWTYNQGVIIGGLVELARAGGNDPSLFAAARELADASTTDATLNPGGILREPCESSADHCGVDGPSFKGVYVRNLGELDRAVGGHPYQAYLERQADSLASTHDSLGQYGVSWTGPIDRTDGARQQSALDALISAHLSSP